MEHWKKTYGANDLKILKLKMVKASGVGLGVLCRRRTAQSNFSVNDSPSKPSDNTAANMAPKKKVERAAQENISLGPQVREGLYITQTLVYSNERYG